MVWNSTQSALYKAVDAHNGCVFEGGKRGEKNVEKTPGKAAVNERERRPENGRFEGCGSRPKNRPKTAPADPISRILSDGDMLLIAGLIFVLMRENADKKLILALAIVLLGQIAQ